MNLGTRKKRLHIIFRPAFKDVEQNKALKSLMVNRWCLAV
jgi:hypothetical protein